MSEKKEEIKIKKTFDKPASDEEKTQVVHEETVKTEDRESTE